MSNVVLNVSDVQKSFGGLRALSDINLQIETGKTHAIIGPNGAGKSTLLNVCVGRIAPDSGSVIFNGQVLTGKNPHERSEEQTSELQSLLRISYAVFCSTKK